MDDWMDVIFIHFCPFTYWHLMPHTATLQKDKAASQCKVLSWLFPVIHSKSHEVPKFATGPAALPGQLPQPLFIISSKSSFNSVMDILISKFGLSNFATQPKLPCLGNNCVSLLGHSTLNAKILIAAFWLGDGGWLGDIACCMCDFGFGLAWATTEILEQTFAKHESLNKQKLRRSHCCPAWARTASQFVKLRRAVVERASLKKNKSDLPMALEISSLENSHVTSSATQTVYDPKVPYTSESSPTPSCPSRRRPFIW